MRPVTGDTITDEQIATSGADQLDIYISLNGHMAAECPFCGESSGDLCRSETRVGAPRIDRAHNQRYAACRAARARCAEIWNARFGGES